MSWDYQHASSPINLKKILRAEVPKDYEVIKDVVVGSTWYAALNHKETGEVHAVVVLTHINRNEYCNFGYKWIDETCGPLECNCPESILSLLSPNDDENALQWRERCLNSISRAL
jgi:hypothetical protein